MKKLLLLIVVILTLLPLFHSGLFDVHDRTAITRMFALFQTVRDGQFPAAWSNLLNFGYGYPLFLYYAPIFTYLGAFLKIFTPTYLLAFKLSLFILTVLGSWGMYKLMRKYGESVALLSSASYTLLPYHASTLYVRGAYAEFTTIALLPWLLYWWDKKQVERRTILLTSIITMLFFLSHNSLPFLFLPALLVWILISQKESWKGALLSIVLSFMLSAWFLSPVFFERGFVQVDLISKISDFHDHFVTLGQLWSSPWGYGGSALGTISDGMSFMIGKSQLLFAATAILYLLFKRINKWQHWFFAGILFFYIYLATSSSIWIWDLFSQLSVVQFPWRTLSFIGLATCYFTGLILYIFPVKWRSFFATIFIIIISTYSLKFFVPQSPLNYTDSDYTSQGALDITAKDKIPEYLPKWMPSFPTSRSESSAIIAPTAYMPQWELVVDGQKYPIYPNANGLVTTDNPISNGNHQIKLIWKRTFIENLGIWISLLGIVVMIGLSL